MSEPMQVGTEENIRLIGKIKQVGAPSPTVPLTVKCKFGYGSYYVILCNAVRPKAKNKYFAILLTLVDLDVGAVILARKGQFLVALGI
jgi:hypothetical protein